MGVKNSMVFNPWEVEQIIGIYERSNGNASRAARILKEEGLQVSPMSVLNYWKKVGLDIRGRGGRQVGKKPGNSLTDEVIDKILDSYERFEGNLKNAAEHFGVARSTISRHWRSAGLEPVNPAKLTPEQQQEIVEAYKKSGRSISVAAHLTGRAKTTVKRYWDVQGFTYVKRADLDHLTIDRLI